MDLVEREFYRAVTPAQLVNGALVGLKESGASIQQVAAAATMTEAQAAFTRQYDELIRAKPELAEENRLTQACMRGLVQALDDPETRYMIPLPYAKLQAQFSQGDFGGVGIYIELDEKTPEKWLTIVEPIDDTPAAAAGLQPRDVILQVDGKSTRGMMLDEVQSMLRGKTGTQVTLTIGRGKQAPFDVVLTRALLRVRNVKSVLYEHVGYLRLRAMSDRSGEELEEAMRELEASGVRAWILDLRRNGVGNTEVAVDVASKFLPTGSRVVTLQSREGRLHYESRPNLRTQLPTVVLIDQLTSGPAEVVAAALQFHKHANVVGARSAGKGRYQAIYPFPDGAALRLTVGSYLTPVGSELAGKGVSPDIPVEGEFGTFGPDDVQLSRALQLLQR